MMWPILVGFGLLLFSSRKQKKKVQPRQPIGPGSPCDPLVTEGLPPGYGCFERNDGNFYVTQEADPAAPPPINYGPFVDDQGIEESLTVLGFTGEFKTKLAAFQRYALEFFDLKDGSIRTDGRLDNKTIDYLGRAMSAYEGGGWTSPTEQHEQDTLLNFEYDNSVQIVAAWQEMPVYEWQLPDGEVPQAEPGASVASWLANIVYWGTYGAGESDSEAPTYFYPIPGTDRWDAEAKYRDAWMRIHNYIELLMEEAGIPNTDIPENVA